MEKLSPERRVLLLDPVSEPFQRFVLGHRRGPGALVLHGLGSEITAGTGPAGRSLQTPPFHSRPPAPAPKWWQVGAGASGRERCALSWLDMLGTGRRGGKGIRVTRKKEASNRRLCGNQVTGVIALRGKQRRHSLSQVQWEGCVRRQWPPQLQQPLSPGRGAGLGKQLAMNLPPLLLPRCILGNARLPGLPSWFRGQTCHLWAFNLISKGRLPAVYKQPPQVALRGS